MRLLLHIGMHKTGTTALQQALADARPALLRHGVLYPRVRIHPTNHNFLALLLREGDNLSPRFRAIYGERSDQLWQDFEANWAQIRQQVARHRPHTLILSGESMFRGLQTGEPARLKARLLELTDDIQTVAYIRQPSRHYLSAIQQRLKSSARFPPPGPAQLRQPLEACETLFGRPLALIPYERARLHEGDITRDFLQRFFPDIAPALSLASLPELNESLSAEAMAILQDYRQANHAGADEHITADSVRLQRLLQKLERHHQLARRPALNDEVARYIDHASVDLVWLAEKYGIRFDAIDYGAIRAMPDSPCRALDQVAQVCQVDAARKQRLLMLATHALLSRQFSLPAPLHAWLQRHAGSPLLQWVVAARNWLRRRRAALSGQRKRA